jgi:hypothetical protein
MIGSSRGGGRGLQGGGRGGRGLLIPQHVLTQIDELSNQRDEARAQIAELVRMRDDARAGSAALQADYDLLRDSYAETRRAKDQAVADKERAEALLELECQSANLERLECKVLKATLEQELELSLVLTASKLKDAATLASGFGPPASPASAFASSAPAPAASVSPIFAFGGGGSTAPPSGGLFTFGAGTPAAPAFGEGAAPALGGFGGGASPAFGGVGASDANPFDVGSGAGGKQRVMKKFKRPFKGGA